MGTFKRLDPLNILVAGLCMECKLPILTDRWADFKGIRGLVLVPTGNIDRFETGAEILEGIR
jgi:hypothetical protein